MVKYSYNAFGVHSITYDNSGVDLGNINPFRFKGYYYDKESEMYYCQSRYYVPEWGRWLNADNAAFLDFNSLNSMNLYAYCGNEPILGVDTNGAFDDERFLKGLGIVGATLFVSALTFGLLKEPVRGIVFGGVISAAGDIFSQAVVENKALNDVDWWQVAVSGVSGAISAIPGMPLWGSSVISGIAGVANSRLSGEDWSIAILSGIESASITFAAGLITRGIGMSKLMKTDKANYAKKKIFLNHTDNMQLMSFNPAINKQQGMIGFIKSQIGLSGLFQLANDTAGAFINLLADILTAIF